MKHLSAVRQLVAELAAPMTDTAGCPVTVRVRETAGGRNIAVTYTATLMLERQLRVDVQTLALDHVGDVAGFLTALVDDRCRPWAAAVGVNAGLAASVWEADRDGFHV